MTRDTEVWLGPMLEAMLSSLEGSASFARLIERATAAADGEDSGVDWILVGQLIRAELNWDHYPDAPPNGHR